MTTVEKGLAADILTQVMERAGEGRVAACIQCGVCSGSCPVGHVMAFPPRLAIAAMRAGLVSRVVSSNTPWLCVGCLTCTSRCPSQVVIAEALIPALREALVADGTRVPAELQTVFESASRYGNPLGQSPRKRGDWVRQCVSPVPLLPRTREPVDVLWFVECYPAYHPRAQLVAKAMAELLNALGVRFGILGDQELCSGDNFRLAGERGLFESLVEKNLRTFAKYQFGEVVVCDPHAYNALKNEYPRYGFKRPVHHYTQFLAARLGKLKPLLTEPLNKAVTFHDPCYLGRKNGIYDEPRQLLQAIPGLKLVEMSRNRENSLCCGGGAGGMWLDTYASQYAPSRLSEKRVVEASKAGAQILAVACPLDLLRFEDAVKTQGLEGRLVVKDILELLYEASGG
ncbi:MAG: (Fe-S)-binding protein [Chloroflexota bacterium]|nr:(Fe-S)-binding protein [Chloroflexota bacterium]